jgi:hypothetical protein
MCNELAKGISSSQKCINYFLIIKLFTRTDLADLKTRCKTKLKNNGSNLDLSLVGVFFKLGTATFYFGSAKYV